MEKNPIVKDIEEFSKMLTEKPRDASPFIVFISLEQWRAMQETKDGKP